MFVTFSPVNKYLDSITFISRVSFWLQMHLYFWCNIMNFWYIVDMIISWFTSNFINLIIFWIGHSHPKHGIFDSFQLWYISHIQIDDCWRFVNRQFISTSLQIILEIKKIQNSPPISLEDTCFYLSVITYFFFFFVSIGIITCASKFSISRE